MVGGDCSFCFYFCLGGQPATKATRMKALRGHAINNEKKERQNANTTSAGPIFFFCFGGEGGMGWGFFVQGMIVVSFFFCFFGKPKIGDATNLRRVRAYALGKERMIPCAGKAGRGKITRRERLGERDGSRGKRPDPESQGTLGGRSARREHC
jgi:hypothetical protein